MGATSLLRREFLAPLLIVGGISGCADPADDPPPSYQIAESFLKLTSPDNRPIEVNPAAIVALRPPLYKEHVSKGVECIISIGTQNFAVKEDCAEVDRRLRRPPP